MFSRTVYRNEIESLAEDAIEMATFEQGDDDSVDFNELCHDILAEIIADHQWVKPSARSAERRAVLDYSPNRDAYLDAVGLPSSESDSPRYKVYFAMLADAKKALDFLLE